MNPSQDVKLAAQTISRRLFILVFRSLAGVLLVLLALLVLAVWGLLSLTYANPESIEPVQVYLLQSHYETRGSWVGVENVYARSSNVTEEIGRRGWNNSLLLDANGIVVIENGRADAPMVGQPYTIASNESTVKLVVNGQWVGTLVLTYLKPLGPLMVFLPAMMPFSLLAISLGALALLIGVALMRRVVAPLAEVIAAAKSVSSGNLAARANVSGPSDLRALSDSFNQMAESLDRNDRERREMLAIIAHELRTPITVLRGRLEGIVDGIYPADESHIAGALEETYLLERLVEDLRLLTLAETGQLHFDLRSIELSGLIRRVTELFSAEAEEQKVQLHVEASPLPEVLVDPQRVEQAVGNLLSNSLRYVPEGGQIWVTLHQPLQTMRLELSVVDNGPGVPEEALPHLFDRFWRGDAVRARGRSAGGSGLGLAIARQLVLAQGGVITACNRPEGGLQVTISFPLR